MATFIKSGFWERTQKGYDHWLNLDLFVKKYINENTVSEAPEDGLQYGRQNGTWTEITGGGGTLPTGTERQVVGFDENGDAKAVTIGWKQLSDLPSPPTFSNGIYTGTAFQPDGSALFAFLELGIDSPDSVARPNNIPIYQAGTIGTGGGTLPVQDPINDLDAANKRWVSANFQENKNRNDFLGIFDVSENVNSFYNDYTTGSILNLSLSTIKTFGSIATVRIKGSLLGYIPFTWNFSGEEISTDNTKLNELSIIYISDIDIRIVNRVVELDNENKWLIPSYTSVTFPVQIPNNSITEQDGKIYPTTYGGTGYGNKGLSLKYLPLNTDGGVVFRKETIQDGDIVIGFSDINQPTSFTTMRVGMYLSTGFEGIYYIENGIDGYVSTSLIGVYYRLYRFSGVFKLQSSFDGLSWTDIRTYAYSNSNPMYLVIDVNNADANAPSEMFYVQTKGLVL